MLYHLSHTNMIYINPANLAILSFLAGVNPLAKTILTAKRLRTAQKKYANELKTPSDVSLSLYPYYAKTQPARATISICWSLSTRLLFTFMLSDGELRQPGRKKEKKKRKDGDSNPRPRMFIHCSAAVFKPILLAV